MRGFIVCFLVCAASGTLRPNGRAQRRIALETLVAIFRNFVLSFFKEKGIAFKNNAAPGSQDVLFPLHCPAPRFIIYCIQSQTRASVHWCSRDLLSTKI